MLVIPRLAGVVVETPERQRRPLRCSPELDPMLRESRRLLREALKPCQILRSRNSRREVRNRQGCWSASEGFRPDLEDWDNTESSASTSTAICPEYDRQEKLTNQILVISRVTMIALQVVEELLDVRAEAVDRAWCDEAEDLHGAVHANPQLPGTASNGNGSNGGTDGVNVAVSSEPRLSVSSSFSRGTE